MHSEVFMLAQRAGFSDETGLLEVGDGAWEVCAPNSGRYPFTKDVVVVFAVRFEWSELGRDYGCRMCIIDADGQLVSEEQRFEIERGRDSRLPPGESQLKRGFTLLKAELKRPGIYAVVLEIGGEEVARTLFSAQTR